MDNKILALWLACQVLSVAAAPQTSNTQPPPKKSTFSCAGRQMGLFADVETNCRAYHTCDDHGNHFMNYCPQNTAFRQDAMICDHAYLVDCQANIDSVNRQMNIGQDNNHDAPPLSFVEPRGEGTNVNGFSRSFRINPDSKSSSSTKHPTFVLNSSVFLKNREASTGQKVASTGTRVTDNEFSMTRVSPRDYTQNPFLASYTKTTSSDESISTDSFIPLSRELQPPPESSTESQKIEKARNDDYSFLIPPPVRNDNFNFSSNSFATQKIDNLRSSDSRQSFTSAEFANIDSSNSFEKDSLETFTFSPRTSSNSFKKDSLETVTFSPRTTMILEMMKARDLGDSSESSFSKPSKFLLPPVFKTDHAAFARANFNFRTDDYPYKETLRSIQNNKATTAATTTPSPLRIHVTDASIFAVPSKTLAPAKESDKDPYYPKPPTSTESYYTSQLQSDKSRKPQFTTTRRPFTNSAKFEIPAVLPDLNSLEDLLDRRKFFFIPQIKS